MERGPVSASRLTGSFAEAEDAAGRGRLVHIAPSRGWISLQLRDLWAYRELAYFLAWRDVKVRYKQTALGAGWAVLQPFLTMVVLSVFFGHLARVPSNGLPYPVFAYAALVPWTFFVYGLTTASNSLVGNGNLITKVYFPRLTMPVASVLSGIVDFVIAFIVLLAMMLYFGVAPSVTIVWLPAFLALALATALGAGLWLSALNVEYRDVRYVVPFLTQFWLFVTPVAYPSSLLHEPWRTLYGLNPMAGVVDGFRWSLLGIHYVPASEVLLSAAVAVLLLVSGAFYFRRVEKTFADRV